MKDKVKKIITSKAPIIIKDLKETSMNKYKHNKHH